MPRGRKKKVVVKVDEISEIATAIEQASTPVVEDNPTTDIPETIVEEVEIVETPATLRPYAADIRHNYPEDLSQDDIDLVVRQWLIDGKEIDNLFVTPKQAQSIKDNKLKLQEQIMLNVGL